MYKNLQILLVLLLASSLIHASDQAQTQECCICGWRTEASAYVEDNLFSQQDKGYKPAFCCYPCCFSFKTIVSGKLVGMETQYCDGCFGKTLWYCRPTCYCDCNLFACIGCLQGLSLRQCFCGTQFDDTGYLCEANNVCAKASQYSCGFRCEGCDDCSKKECCRVSFKCLGNCFVLCCLTILEAFGGGD